MVSYVSIRYWIIATDCTFHTFRQYSGEIEEPGGAGGAEAIPPKEQSHHCCDQQ